MPCQDDGQAAHYAAEQYEKKVKEMLYYLQRGLHLAEELPAPRPGYGYPDRDQLTEALCTRIRGLTPAQKEALLYKRGNRMAAQVLCWWLEHKKADDRRLAREAQERHEKAIQEQALQKLSPQERKALGKPPGIKDERTERRKSYEAQPETVTNRSSGAALSVNYPSTRRAATGRRSR